MPNHSNCDRARALAGWLLLLVLALIAVLVSRPCPVFGEALVADPIIYIRGLERLPEAIQDRLFARFSRSVMMKPDFEALLHAWKMPEGERTRIKSALTGRRWVTLERLEELGVPKDLQKKVQESADQQVYAISYLADTTPRGQIHAAHLGPGGTRRAHVFSEEDATAMYVLVHVTGPDDLWVYREAKTGQATTTGSPEPSTGTTQTPAAGKVQPPDVRGLDHDLVVTIWLVEHGPVTKQLVRLDGRQSRDLADTVIKGVSDGTVALVGGTQCFTFKASFYDANWEAMRRDGIRVTNGLIALPQNWGTAVWTVDVPVCNGRGLLVIKESWIQKHTGLVVMGETALFPFWYPASGRLTKCAASERPEKEFLYCGAYWKHAEGELWREVQARANGKYRQGTGDAIFVLRPGFKP